MATGFSQKFLLTPCVKNIFSISLHGGKQPFQKTP